jgi:TolA-binding protein
MRNRILFVAALIATAAASARAIADGGDDQFAVASSHYGQRRWQLAVKEFDALARQFPSHRRCADASFFAGESLVQLGDYAEATKRYQHFLSQNSDHTYRRNAQYRLAEVYYLAGSHAQARTEFAKFAAAYPDDKLMNYVLPYLGSALLELAEIEERQKTIALAAEAESRFTEALRRFPVGPLKDECRFGLARTAHLQNRFDSAKVGYTSLLSSPRRKLAQQSRYHLGSIHFERNEFQSAAQHYAELIAAAPTSRWAKAARGPWLVALTRSNKLDDAQRTLAQWDKSGEIRDLDLATFAHLADAAFTAEKLDWASELFQVLAGAKNSPDYRARGLSGQAWVRYRQQQHEAATAAFGELVANYADHQLAAEAAFMHAAILEKLGKKSEATSAYRLVVDRYPDYDERPQAVFRLGVLSEEQGHAKIAAALYGQLLDEYGDDWPNPDAILFRIAWINQREGNQAEAIAAFTSVYERHQASKFWPEATYRLAKHEFENEQHHAARARLAEVLRSEPTAEILAHALYLDARAAQIVGGWNEVEKPLARLLAEVPDSNLHPAAQFWLAEAFYQQDRFDEARRQFAKLSGDLEGRTDRWVPTVHLRTAQLLALDRKWRESLESARSLLAADPDTSHAQDIHFLIGRCLAAQARFDEARDVYLKAAPRDGSLKNDTAAQAQWMIGESYMHQENYQQAIEEYFRVDALFAFPRWQAAALLQAGKCYEQLKKPIDAVVLYRRIVEQYPDTSFANEATQRLRAAEVKKP